jgi:hypothetical protein
VLSNADIKAAYPKFALTDNPWGRGVIGCSSGGAAALTMGWFRPEWFRRIIAYSATLVSNQDDDAPERVPFPLGAWEYHSGMKLIESSEVKPLRIFTHVSEKDLHSNDPEETHHNWVIAGLASEAGLRRKAIIIASCSARTRAIATSVSSSKHSPTHWYGSGVGIALSNTENTHHPGIKTALPRVLPPHPFFLWNKEIASYVPLVGRTSRKVSRRDQ